MNKTVFEARGEQMIAQKGMTKAEFARCVGIQRQNVKALFRSHNLETMQKVAEVLDVPLVYLIGYVEPVDLSEPPFGGVMVPAESEEELVIGPEDVPTGDFWADVKARRNLIKQFYIKWMSEHPEGKLYNRSLKDDIHVKYISLNETSAHASMSYLSTLAVLQLDAILQNARFVKNLPAKTQSKNQKGFKRMLLMEYVLPGIGKIRLTVGVKSLDETKVQYCITAIAPLENSKKQSR